MATYSSERGARLATDIMTLETPSGYPARMPYFKSSLTEVELDTEFAETVNADCSCTIDFLKECKRRTALEIIHRTAALHMRRAQHLTCLEEATKKTTTVTIEEFANTCLEVENKLKIIQLRQYL